MSTFFHLHSGSLFRKSLKTTRKQWDPLGLCSQINVSGLNVIVDLTFTDFICSSDYLYMWRNWINWGKTRASNFIIALLLLLTDIYQSEQSQCVGHPPLFCPSFLLWLGFLQGTSLPLLHPLSLCNCITNVPTQSSVTEVGVPVSVICTKAETMHE